jgi:5'-AMP-activated protein kinase catalytic alpha subunit
LIYNEDNDFRTELLLHRVLRLLARRTIGRGTFGKVKKAIHIHTQEPVAIKILQKNKIKDITDVERVTRELHILKLVRHSSIAQLY